MKLHGRLSCSIYMPQQIAIVPSKNEQRMILCHVIAAPYNHQDANEQMPSGSPMREPYGEWLIHDRNDLCEECDTIEVYSRMLCGLC